MIAAQIQSVRDQTHCFFAALERLDFCNVSAMYANDSTYFNSIVGEVRGAEIIKIWKAVLSSTERLVVSDRFIDAGTTRSRSEFDISYVDTLSGRSVKTRMRSALVFSESRILYHLDEFDDWSWSSMAYGMPSALFGWTKLWRKKVTLRFRAPNEFQSGDPLPND